MGQFMGQLILLLKLILDWYFWKKWENYIQENVLETSTLEPLLLTWINFNPSMDM